MPWANSGTVQFWDVQQATRATQEDMAALKKQIDNWDNASGPNSSQHFAFGKLRGHDVTVKKSNGQIVAVSYGDR